MVVTPFENLIEELSRTMDLRLHPDNHQSCLIHFIKEDMSIQIDLDVNADRILLGTQLGRITPGTYREKMFLQALKVNGTGQPPRGILAFSEKNDTLILYQFLEMNRLTGERLYQFLELFRSHAKIWKEALHSGEIPLLAEESSSSENKMFGLRP